MKKLIVFADYGLDDAAATFSLFSSKNRPESITLVPIGGNVPVGMSFANCITLTNLILSGDERVTVVDTRAIKQPNEYLADIHGNDGMGDIFEPIADSSHAELIGFDEWLDTLSGDETLLSLGPMTLVERLLERYPDCPLVIMGGCVKTEPNFKGYEFNQALDPEAFARCVKREHVAITLDTCRCEKLDMRRLKLDGDDHHSRILRADQRLSITRGEDGCYVWDDVAAAYYLHPERFVIEKGLDRQGNLLSNAVYISEKEYFED